MTVPDVQSLMLPVLRVAGEGELTVVEAREKIAAARGLTKEDLAQLLPSGQQTTFANRVAWAKTHLDGGSRRKRAPRRLPHHRPGTLRAVACARAH